MVSVSSLVFWLLWPVIEQGSPLKLETRLLTAVTVSGRAGSLFSILGPGAQRLGVCSSEDGQILREWENGGVWQTGSLPRLQAVYVVSEPQIFLASTTLLYILWYLNYIILNFYMIQTILYVSTIISNKFIIWEFLTCVHSDHVNHNTPPHTSHNPHDHVCFPTSCPFLTVHWVCSVLCLCALSLLSAVLVCIHVGYPHGQPERVAYLKKKTFEVFYPGGLQLPKLLI